MYFRLFQLSNIYDNISYMKSRVFLAINIPLRVKEDIANIYLKLAKYLPIKGIKFVEKDNLHITLHFLGDQTPKKIEQIKKIAKDLVIILNPFTVSLGGINAFPNKSFPRIIILNIDKGGDCIKKIINDLGRRLSGIGVEIDKRALKAHITLVRIKSGKVEFEKLEEIKKDNIDWQVKGFDLVESKLTENGPIYNILEHFSF